MRQFTISAAAMTVIAALVAPAWADHLGGGPIKNGSQCFTNASSFSRDARFGSWGTCPQTASVAVAPQQTQQNRRRRAGSR